MRIILIFTVFLVSIVQTMAQINQIGNEDRIQRNIDQSSSDSLVIGDLDTLSNAIYAYQLDFPKQQKLIIDSSLTKFEEYDFSRQQSDLYWTLGNLGSAAFPVFEKHQLSNRYTLGYKHHKIYQFKESDIRFYKLEKPISKIGFFTGSNQASFRSNAFVARDFANKLKFTLRFNRINSDAVYQATQIRHTRLYAGIYQEIDSTKWAYALSFINNSNFESFNGGVDNQLDFNSENYLIRSSIPVRFNDVYTYHLNRNYGARVFYTIFKNTEKEIYLQAKVNHKRSSYKFINKNISVQDTTYFGEAQITSPLGMRTVAKHQRYNSRLSAHYNQANLESMLWFKYGLNRIRHSKVRYKHESLVGLDARINYWGMQIKLNSSAGLIAGLLSYQIKPRIQYQHKKKLQLFVGLNLQSNPSFDQYNYRSITFKEVYNRKPIAIHQQSFEAGIQLPFIGLQTRIELCNTNNHIGHDDDGISWKSYNYRFMRLHLEEQLKFRWLNFHTSLVYQNSQNAPYSMPSWYNQSKLFLEGYLFNALRFQFGVNADYIPGFKRPKFNALTGNLYGASDEISTAMYRLDPFVSIKVQGFKFYAKYEHLNALWQPGVQMQIDGYPQLDARLRLGASWILRN